VSDGERPVEGIGILHEGPHGTRAGRAIQDNAATDVAARVPGEPLQGRLRRARRQGKRAQNVDVLGLEQPATDRDRNARMAGHRGPDPRLRVAGEVAEERHRASRVAGDRAAHIRLAIGRESPEQPDRNRWLPRDALAHPGGADARDGSGVRGH